MDVGQSIAVDNTGRAYVTGTTSSFDFPISGALQAHPAGFFDGFISVLDPTGSQLAWSTYLGGSDDDRPYSIVVDPAGDLHLTGWTLSSNFPLAQAAQQRPASVFVSKLKGDGSGLIFSTYLGGSGSDTPGAVAADPAGNTYVAGITSSTELSEAESAASVAGRHAERLRHFVERPDRRAQLFHLPRRQRQRWRRRNCRRFRRQCLYRWFDHVVRFPGEIYVIGGGEDAFLAKIAPASGPSIALGGVTNAASYGTVLSPGEMASIFGTALAVTPASASGAPLPVKLSDVTVTVNGAAAPLFFVSPVQINAQIPFETEAGQAQIQVSSSAGIAMLSATIAAAAPAIFSLNSQGTGAGAIEHGATGELVTDADPAMPSEVISIYCTGLGAVSPPVADGAAAPVPRPKPRRLSKCPLRECRRRCSTRALRPDSRGCIR